MSPLFVMRRPGIVIVNGTVEEASRNQLVVCNDWYFPVSRQTERIKCHLETADGLAERMRIRPGASIIASCTDNFKVEMLLAGGEIPDRTYSLKAYTVRYNGCFDFEEHGQEKEQHVFSGSVMNVHAKMDKPRNSKRTVLTLTWKRNGDNEVRTLVYWGDRNEDLSWLQDKKAIFVTGPSFQSRTGRTYYPVTNFITC